jgi:leucyl aminopeptidase
VALQLAQLVMAEQLPVRLHLLIAAVENAIGPNAYRPGEVIATRAGLSVEIGNTDAEGRVVLCDAITYACESEPELMFDFATLTGAARIALGPDLPALFSNREELSLDLIAAGREAGDPLWAMPLWDDYYSLIDSKIADLNNSGASRMAGAITAALYLKRFVPERIPWAHLDTYCWSEGRPGRPAGGDCQGLRAAYAYLQQRYG